ncbi:hypothetical protein HHK36_009112 [Tetracentron sinense]|uniref:Uncharacterized protein n=1 Tax=Tetracentron sinense TaxID=13715 RepID=A0A834ZEU6_TETSI|nr:hypothetical protein HHK36_009112 [Tetracentron sinense]
MVQIPFLIDELHKLDYAEGVLFEQLFRMPYSHYASDGLKEDEYLSLKDFLHATVDGLGRTSWHKNGPLPFFVSCPHHPGSKFYTAEREIPRGRLGGLSGAALIRKNCEQFTSLVSLEYPGDLLAVYVEIHPSRLQPSWEDMSLWYQVQRQTKVLNILKQQGISSKYLPEIIASGRNLHSVLARSRAQGVDVIMHACDITRCSERCNNGQNPEWRPLFREHNTQPRSKLAVLNSCASIGEAVFDIDSESPIYLLYFVLGGVDCSNWNPLNLRCSGGIDAGAGVLIQQQLAEVSALLKAFADYVDSLCGTPYPVDYDLWLKGLNIGYTAIDGTADRGKLIEIDVMMGLENVAESLGTCGGCGTYFSC